MYSNGNKYRGMWADGYPDGHGVYTWADGGEYQGMFRNGKKEGQGLLVLNGVRYEGYFLND